MWLTLFWFFQLIFEKEGVYLHTNAKKMVQDMSLPGFIRVVERVSRPASANTSLVRRALTTVSLPGWGPCSRVEPPGGRRSQCPCSSLLQKGQGSLSQLTSAFCCMFIEMESDF